MKLRQDQTWLIVFSDLSTNLMFMFLMLFALTRMDGSQRNEYLKGMKSISIQEGAAFSEVVAGGFIEKYSENSPAGTAPGALSAGEEKDALPEIYYDSYKMKIALVRETAFDGSDRLTEKAAAMLRDVLPSVRSAGFNYVISGQTDYSEAGMEREVKRMKAVKELMLNSGLARDSIFYNASFRGRQSDPKGPRYENSGQEILIRILKK